MPILFFGAHSDDPGPVERLRRSVPQTATIQLAMWSHDLLRDAPDALAQEVGSWLGALSW